MVPSPITLPARQTFHPQLCLLVSQAIVGPGGLTPPTPHPHPHPSTVPTPCSFGQTWLTRVPLAMMSQREGAVCPVRPSFTPVDSPSQTNWFAKVQAASPACFAYRTLPGDTIKSGQAHRGAQQGLAGSKSKLHTPLTSVWFERSLCVWENSRRIQSFIKGHYFSTALNTHTHTNWDWRRGKNWGLHHIVYCACKIYVLWSPAINTQYFSIKVHINPLSPLAFKSDSSWPGKQGQMEYFIALFYCFLFLLLWLQVAWWWAKAVLLLVAFCMPSIWSHKPLCSTYLSCRMSVCVRRGWDLKKQEQSSFTLPKAIQGTMAIATDIKPSRRCQSCIPIMCYILFE